MARDVTTFYKVDMSGETDSASALAHMRADIEALAAKRSPLPKLVFPEGICSFSEWPNMAFHNLSMEAQGQTILRYTGRGDAVVFMGEEPGGLAGLGKRNLSFEGFTIDPGPIARDGLSLNSIHASNVKVKVNGAGAPRSGIPNSAITVNYCVGTEIQPTVSSLDLAIDGFGGSLDCFGMTFNTLNGVKEWPASACRITRPVIEGVTTGVYGPAMFFCEFRGGTIEQCQIGALLSCTGTLLDHVEMEGNKQWDVAFTKDAKNNVLAYCGDGSRKRFRVRDDSTFGNNQILHIGSLWS